MDITVLVLAITYLFGKSSTTATLLAVFSILYVVCSTIITIELAKKDDD